MAQRVSSPVFVGREPELDRISEALDQAASGQSAVFLVAGEAGVGKTRFVAEVAARARRHGLRVLEGGCVQVGSEGLPFGPFVEALRGLSSELPAGELEELLGAGRPELTRLMPHLLRTGESAQSDDADPTRRSRLFEHVLLLLQRLATTSPVLLAVEDLHWADRSSLDLLGFLVRNVRGRRVVILATYRSDELHRRHPLLPFLAEQERAGRAERIELRRFDRFELATQIRAIKGQEPPPDLVDRILARSQGNAFFAEELIAAPATTGALPETLREVLLARITTISEPAQELVRVAAAGGARVTPALIATVMGTDQRRLDDGLDEAVANSILVPLRGSARESYAFRHALVQEAVYAELLPGPRTRLHGAFAQALADEAGGEPDAAQAAEIAYHWQAANDLPRAFDAWLAAGIGAERIDATTEAAVNFDHALDLWDRIPDADQRAPVDRIEVLVKAARAVEGTSPAPSVEYLRAAIALVDPGVDPVRAGLLHEKLGHDLTIVGDNAGSRAAYEEGVRLVPAEPPSMARAHVLAGLGTWFAHESRAAESAAHCAEAVAIGDAIGVPVVWAMIPLGVAQGMLGDLDTGLATLDAAQDTAEARGSTYEIARAMGFRVRALLEAGRYQETIAASIEAEAWAASHGMAAGWAANDALGRAEALMPLGRWDEAADAIRAARRYGRSLADHWVERQAALLEVLRGQFESARERLARQPPRWLAHDIAVFAAPAELALWTGDALAAREAIGLALATRTGEQPAVVRARGAALALAIRAEADVAALARARHADADVDEALGLGAGCLRQMRSVVDEVRSQRPIYLPMATASLALCEAEFTRLEGRPDPDAWATAAQAHDGQPYLRAYALMREGEAALAGPRDRARAANVLDEARVTATALGARPLLRLIETLGTAAGPARQPVGPARAEARGRYDLSPRELEVLALLALGRSDGDIADALFISKKTASVHIANIKGKLGAQSRIEIITRAMALGLVEAPSVGTA